MVKHSKGSTVKRSLISFALVFCVAFALPNLSQAATHTYDFVFDPPFVGSAESTPTQEVTSLNSAYVYPKHSATPTSYILATAPGSSTEVTDFRTDISTSGKFSFTYKSGYGGVGNNYSLTGYPSNNSFVHYTVGGEWSP